MKTQNSTRHDKEGYSIRPAEAADIPRLAAVELAAASIFPKDALPDGVAEETMLEAALLEAAENGMLWVAVDGGGEPVGFALLQRCDGLALLAEIDVHPAHGRKGLGAALVRKVADAAGETVYLTTFSDIPWNAPFYEKLGFIRLDPGTEPPPVQAVLRRERESGLRGRIAMKREG